jgi:hypothetical protein
MIRRFSANRRRGQGRWPERAGASPVPVHPKRGRITMLRLIGAIVLIVVVLALLMVFGLLDAIF